MHDTKRKRINKLIDDISFFRDLKNDYNDEFMSQELEKLEEIALELLNFNLGPEIAPVNVAIIGNFSCGKSTFVNSLIGAEVCPTRINPTTSSITKFLYGEQPEIYHLQDGEYVQSITHDEYFTMCQHQKGLTKETTTYELHYYYPFNVLKSISIFDTPGFKNRLNANDQYVTKQVASNSDVVFLLLDANNSSDIDADLESILQNISDKNTRLRWYYVLNRCDQKTQSATKKLLNYAINKYGDRFDGYFMYSAKKAIDEFIIFEKMNKNIQSENYIEIYNKVADDVFAILDECKKSININNNCVAKPKCNNSKKFNDKNLNLIDVNYEYFINDLKKIYSITSKSIYMC